MGVGVKCKFEWRQKQNNNQSRWRMRTRGDNKEQVEMYTDTVRLWICTGEWRIVRVLVIHVVETK